MKNLNKYIEFKNITWKYFVCWGILGLFSILFFMYNFDYPLTVWQADDMLTNLKSGHFGNFYSYIIELANEGRYDVFGYPSREYYVAAYNIVVYIVLALWILPMRFVCWIFGINYSLLALSMWCKLLLILADLIAIRELGEVFVLMGWNKKECNVGVACFMSSAIIMFGSLMFGQVEIFTVVIIIYSIKMYLKKEYDKFCLIGAVAICFKGFAILVIVPMILLVEKRIFKLVKYVIEMLSLTLIWNMTFGRTEGYLKTKEIIDRLYNFKSYLWSNEVCGNSLIMLLVVIICCMCYYVKWDEKEIQKKFYIPVVCMLGSFFSLIPSHPQWWVIVVPFLCMAVADMQDNRFALMLYAGISGGYILDTCLNYRGAIDNMMIKYGILPRIIGEKSRNLSIADIYDRFGISTIIVGTFLRACLLMLCCISIFERNKKWKEQKIYAGLMWLQYMITGIFVLASVVLFL